MLIKAELEKNLKTLRLSGMAVTLPARLQQSMDGGMSALEFLEQLIQDELERRKDRLFDRRIKLSRINAQKRLDNFDWHFNPKIPKKDLCNLATTHFIAERENVIFIGPPGTGKSHMAQAVGLCAIHAGYQVLYYPVFELLDLIQATRHGSEWKPLLEKLLQAQLLILDDLGMKRLSTENAEDLLELIMRRYEKTSTLITSNRPIEDWSKILGDAATTSAMLDRLMHHSHCVPFQGKSYRMEQTAALAKSKRNG